MYSQQAMYQQPRSLFVRMLLRENPWLAPQFGLGDETTPPTPTDTTATQPATTSTTQPAVPQRTRRWYPRNRPFPRFSPNQLPPQSASNAVGGGQFYDHQMALATQQNARSQQPAPAPIESGIGGISWPMIALAGGGFLMLMMVMMSGKK